MFQDAPVRFEIHQIGRVTLMVKPARTGIGLALAEAADGPATWPGLGRRDPGPLRLLVADGAGEFGAASAGRVPEWGAGLAMPRARTIVIRVDQAGDPFRTLRHELAHLALHEAVRGRVPLWFDEGYAVVAAGELGRAQALQLNLSLAGGRVPPLRALDRELRAGRLEAEHAYALAGTAVNYLARRHPDGTLDAVFRRLESGTSFAEAVLATTGLTLGQFEVAWQRDTKRRFGLVVWLASGGAWMGVAALVVFGVMARRRRDRPRRAALDEGWVVEPPETEAGPELDQPTNLP